MPYSPRIVYLESSQEPIGYTYHDEVRALLGVDKTVLPDTDIDAPFVLPVAEGRVVARVPDFASLTGDDETFCYAAAISMIAHVLAPSMLARIKAAEGDSDYKYQMQKVDWEKRARDLESMAYGYIDYISTQPVVELPQMAVSGPTTTAQQQLAAQGGGPVEPDDLDLTLYPTDAM